MMQRRRVLVTGGAGFIGVKLCESLLEEGNEVICLDNFTTGAAESVRRLLPSRKFVLVEHDVTEPYDFAVDEVFNLACPASPAHYQRDPLHTFKTSIFGAIHALELAKRTGAKVLQCSTSEIYGDPQVMPQRETYRGNVDPTGPRACYNEGKRAAETLFTDYQRVHGVDARIVRIFNTYGPGILPTDGRVVSNFVSQALAGNDLTVYGDGSQTRSFCYVDDLVDGLIQVMDSPSPFPGPINLGNPEEISIVTLATLVIDLCKSQSSISHAPLPIDDPSRRCPDITLAKRSLNWVPKTPLREGLLRTIDYFTALESKTASTT